ncbi:unnamed protein product [Symbiodinium sp. CCMP2592]|nr:unnamed protein product [Symbiodinium sp. CCMP2592]
MWLWQLCIIAASCLTAHAASVLHIENGIVAADFDQTAGLVAFGHAGQVSDRVEVSGDYWELQLNNRTLSASNGCNSSTAKQDGNIVSFKYLCGNLTVKILYTLPMEAQHLEKQISVSYASTATEAGAINFEAATFMKDTLARWDTAKQAPTWFLRNNAWNQGFEIAGFVRWKDVKSGIFVSVANPFGHQLASAKACADGSPTCAAITASYAGKVTHKPTLQGAEFITEPLVLGLTTLSKYSISGLSTGEARAFKHAVEACQLDRVARAAGTVKVNVAWDENDYQIDVGVDEGKAEYRRIFDRNAELGIDHIVYEPRNSLHASRFNATDDWGWEASLWFSMGEQLRKGLWDPRKDPMPQDILDAVAYAKSKGIGLMAYAYPTMQFEEMRKYWVAGGTNALSLAPAEVQNYFIEVMTAFLQKSGGVGFAWDHDIFAGDKSLQYAQWRGFARILRALRTEFPHIVMDHRQTNHMWGPWYDLSGSYAEPIAGDENPESYGGFAPTLHTDHISADQARAINYGYSTLQLLPSSRVPGFIFHQSERTDDDGHFYCTVRETLCVNNSNTRDFDYLGYKYSLLSSIGTAGLNNVFTMVPARDPAEFEHFPKGDIAFIRNWLTWTDENMKKLQNTEWIPTLPAPSAGNVDGTHAMLENEGFLFLYNPNPMELNATLSVDEAIGLDGKAGQQWDVTELFPHQGPVGTWEFSESIPVTVEGGSARVLELKKHTSPASRRPRLQGLLAHSHFEATSGQLVLQEAVGPSGSEVFATIYMPEEQRGQIVVNGRVCEQGGMAAAGHVKVQIRFKGPSLMGNAPVVPLPAKDFAGGWYNGTFSIPQAYFEQLSALGASYPIPWTTSATGCGLSHCVDDSKATWLVPTRLLMAPFIRQAKQDMAVRLFLDGREVQLSKSYNSRGRVLEHCFLGFYFDASQLEPGIKHDVAVYLPKLEPGQFFGLFWQNTRTVYTDQIDSCSVLPGETGIREPIEVLV